MASSSPFLVQRRNGSSYRFRSIHYLCDLLGISPPYKTCLAYAPYARNPGHCSRPINKNNRPKVPGLLANLLIVNFPSSEAGRLLKELSACVVCGITDWHQNKAPEVYQKWYSILWEEYLRVNGLHPRLCSFVPDRLTRETWELFLEEARSEQEYDSEEEDDSDEDDEDGDDSDPEDDVATPDTTTSSSFDQELSSRYTEPQGGTTNERSSSRLEPRANHLQPSSRRTFSVHRDPEPQPLPRDSPRPSNPSTVGNPQALRQLDRNIPIVGAGNRTSPSWSHEVIEEGSPSPALSRHTCSDNTTRRSEPDTEHDSSDDEGLATPEDESEIEEHDSDDGEEQEQAGSDSLNDHGRSGSAADGDIDSREGDEEEQLAAVAETLNNSQSEAVQLSAAEGNARDGDDFATELLALGEIFSDDDDAGTEPSDEPSTDLTTLIPHHPGFRLYPQAATLPQLKQLLHIMTQTVSPRRRRPGYIYGFSRPSMPGFLKIGYTDDVVVPRRAYPHPVDKRLAKWQADCGHPVMEVFRVHMRCAAIKRIESLVHQTLREYRRVEDPPCGRCGKKGRKSNGGGAKQPSKGVKHNEWFQVDEQTAREVVDIWRQFSDQLPYDRFGRLVDWWSERVDGDRSRVRAGDSAASWTRNMPRMVEELRRRELSDIIGSISVMSLQ